MQNNRVPWQLVEQQLAKWNLMKTERKQDKGDSGPVITISREAGCGTAQIAQKLAEVLHMDLMGGKIIQMVAESAEMSEKVVHSLDEKDISLRDDWISSLFVSRHLWPDQYLFHLTKVIGTIGRHGDAIILGRGANFVLPREKTFSVRIIAPESVKIKNVLRTTEAEAKRYIVKTEADRQAFVRKYFNANLTEPSHYDLVLNMRTFRIEGATKAIATAFQAWMMR